MGVWDFLGHTVSTVGNTFQSFNPLAQGVSLIRMIIGSLVAIIILIILTVWLFRSDSKKESAVRGPLFGVYMKK
jgi:flagellar biogenesis protein FliO